MAKQFQSIEPALREFIERQHVFFVASATPDSRVNVSPKALNALRVLGPNTVAYLDLTGSGNETAAHMLANGRLTIMFCAFEGPPMILRLYGRGRVLRRSSPEYTNLLAEAFEGHGPLGSRHIVVLDIDLVQTSCGFGVPSFEYRGERPSLPRWAEAKGEAGLEAYWLEKNARSIDGLPTGLVDETAAAEALD
ncbi:pyridoxamine 5'-phosphate oxidase family protein [Microvirga massiliensis]|uniref:pyridoxamine 5'-phosphate oxidase family protein n=1 Tax=Microvirga massiliensis TaxID=1033741 RepID=UPI00062B831F|nr:pyridoxamine 5'-phosphate oxidase family protein [Microvirga massiliensis]